jgi:hypothetical protein
MAAPPREGDVDEDLAMVDQHPNLLAHRMLADELYRQLHTAEGLVLLRGKRSER